MDENAIEEMLNPWEMKPPFMLLKSSPGLFQNYSYNKRLPGILKDESRLNQLTNLIDTQKDRNYHVPKPPKKRYLEENYTPNKWLKPVLETVSINANQLNKISEMSDVKKEVINENALYPDVNPILPDVVPKTESKDVETRIEKLSWRKKLLCWEKLEDVDPPKSILRLNSKPASELTNLDGSNNSRKSPVLLNDHYQGNDDILGDSKTGRRGRARACKGQKYREFMWTNIMHQRRKSSRWELCQDIMDSTDNHKQDSLITTRVKTDNTDLTIPKLITRTVKINADVNSINKFYKKTKVSKKKSLIAADKKIELNKKRRGISENPKKKLLKKENDNRIINSSNSSPRKISPIVGSKKRKLRRKSIRRLEPGSNFKDTRVVEDSGLETLASVAVSKMKLRSDINN